MNWKALIKAIGVTLLIAGGFVGIVVFGLHFPVAFLAMAMGITILSVLASLTMLFYIMQFDWERWD